MNKQDEKLLREFYDKKPDSLEWEPQHDLELLKEYRYNKYFVSVEKDEAKKDELYQDFLKDELEYSEGKIRGKESEKIRIKYELPNTGRTENRQIWYGYRDYIKSKIAGNNNTLGPKQEIKNRTKKLIEEKFDAMDKNGWKYAFRSEEDYGIFITLLTDFFEFKEYSKPKEIINLKKGTKTKFAPVLNLIYKELKETVLKSDLEFFEIIRVLNHFKGLSDMEIYKAMTK